MCSAAPSRRSDSARAPWGSSRTRSLRRLPGRLAAAARDIEEDFLQGLAAVAREKVVGRVVVLDAAALHDDDAFAQPLDLVHIVGGEQDGRTAFAPVVFKARAHPVCGVGIE